MDPYSSNPDLSQTNQYHQSRMGEYYKSQPSPPRQSGEPQGCEIPRSSSPHSHREQKARDITQTEASASYLTQQDLDALDENARIEHAIKLSQEACGETVFPKQKPSVPPEEGACALPHLQHQASCTPASNDGQMLIESRNFFFPEDKEGQDRKNALDFLNEKNRNLHTLLINLKETLCDTEVQLDASQLAATVKSIKEQYKELLLEHPTLAQQAGLAHELDDYVREVVRHPSVRLLTEPLEHWSDIIPICLHLNQHREEAIRGASPLDQESNSDQGLESIIQQLKKLLINTDGNLPLSGEELLHRLTPILSVLSSALQGLGTQTHYLHPSKYPTYFATIVSVMKQHGPAIQRAELAMLPVDAVAQRILDLFCVIYRKQNPEGVKILDDALNGHVATWSRQEKRVFAAALISDNPDADETLLCLASRLNHEVEKGQKLEIREDNGQGVWKKLPSSKDHEHQSKELAKVNRNTALVLASEYRPDFSRITVGVTKKHLIIAGLEYPITKRGCDLKVNELNLPQLMKCPSISQHIYRAQIDQHLDALAAGRKNFEWLAPEDKELLKERSTLPKNLEVPIKKRASGEELQRQAAAWKIEPVEERIPGKPSKENAISALFHKALPWKKS